jgi:uroporphyrinogen-III decarboxylase
MNTREKFIEVMQNFNSSVPTVKWEFGFWGETINKWYREGLPRKNPCPIPDSYTTPSASIYTRVWTCKNKYLSENEYPHSMPITGGSHYTPTQGFPSDTEVSGFFSFDAPQVALDLNLQFYPMFDIKVIEETDDVINYRDVDGVKRMSLKNGGFPGGYEWPIKDMKSWQKLKEERVNLKNIKNRLPKNWDDLVKEYSTRDFPLAIGGFPHGFFGLMATLMGYENLFYKYMDEPKLIHDILNTFTDLWIAVYAEVLEKVEVDLLQVWEDVSMGSGSMISPAVIKEFMVPYYKKLTTFVKSNGVNIVLVDTDGYCMDIIPLFIEGGATGMYPFEAHTGMDIVKVRKEFPDFAMMGGIPKSEICKGKQRIDQILEPVGRVLKTGGYVPHCDHFVPPEIPWEEFKYYRNRLNQIIDSK